MEEAINTLTNPCQPEVISEGCAPCSDPCEQPKEKFSLWGIAYHITTNEGIDYSGNALVIARDARHAEQVLKSNSAFNGTPNQIIIEAVAQVPTLTESGLCIEAYTDGVQRRVNYGA